MQQAEFNILREDFNMSYNPTDQEQTVLIDNSQVPYAQPMSNDLMSNMQQPAFDNQGAYTQQPYTQQSYAQQMSGGSSYGQQPMDASYGQQMNYGGQNGYATGPAVPKAPKAPMPKGLKMGLIIGIPSVIVLVILLAVLIPILTRAKLQGEYTYKDRDYDIEYRIVFDEEQYVIYAYNKEEKAEIITSAGVYEYDKEDQEIILTNIEGGELEAEFDDEDNVVEIEGEDFESTDKDQKVELDLSDDYVEKLCEEIEKATGEIFRNDEEAFDDAYDETWYYLSSDEMEDPEDKYVEELVKAIGYEEDETLQALMKYVDEYGDSYLEIEIYVGWDEEDYEVEIEVDEYFCD